MTQFNIQRMKQYAQWQLATHRATLLKITGVATSAFILMFLFVKYVSHRDLQTQSDDLTLLWIGCFAFCGVQVFPNLLSKQERTSLLMLPASNAEKFLTSYIGVLLTAFVVPLVSFFVADALDLLSKFFGENAQIAWAGLPNILWLHSFYLLSGLFFKKLRWLSATITLGALATLTTLSIAIGGFLFLDTLKDSDYSIEFVPWAGDALMHGTSILFLLLTVLNYWLSFRIFKRLQVINNRFFNW